MPVLQAPIGAPSDPTADAQVGFGYSLFVDLMGDEAQVADILAIKSASMMTQALLKDISATAKDATTSITPLLAAQPAVAIDQNGLPIVETSTRNRLTNMLTARLLLAGGSFEVKMLLSQANAMGYARSLSASIAEADPNRARSSIMSQLENLFADLESRAITQLLRLSGQ
jgi:hypothetical protein